MVSWSAIIVAASPSSREPRASPVKSPDRARCVMGTRPGGLLRDPNERRPDRLSLTVQIDADSLFFRHDSSDPAANVQTALLAWMMAGLGEHAIHERLKNAMAESLREWFYRARLATGSATACARCMSLRGRRWSERRIGRRGADGGKIATLSICTKVIDSNQPQFLRALLHLSRELLDRWRDFPGRAEREAHGRIDG